MTDLTNTQTAAGEDAASDDFDTIAAMGSAAFLAQQPAEDDAGATQAGKTTGTEVTTDVNPAAASGNGNEVSPAGQNAQSDLDWAAVSPQYRAAFEAARKAAEDGEQYRRSNEGRLTAHQTKVQKLEAELAALRAANGNADPARATQSNPDAILTQVRAVTKDYPELAPIAEAVQALAESTKAANARFANMDAHAQQAALDRNAAELERLHPGWERDLATPAFAQWFQNSPEFVRRAVEQNGDGIRDLNSAAYIVGLYKSQSGATQAPAQSVNPMADRRKQQLAGATSVNAGNRGAAEGPPIDDFDANFDHFARQSAATRR